MQERDNIGHALTHCAIWLADDNGPAPAVVDHPRLNDVGRKVDQGQHHTIGPNHIGYGPVVESVLERENKPVTRQVRCQHRGS